jgi:hypothetical protein
MNALIKPAVEKPKIEGGKVMAIMVQCKDKSFDFVPNQALDHLIATRSIIAFRRSSG